MFSNLLLAVDGSEASLLAARHGIELARVLNARVTVVSVTVPWTTHFARELAVVVPDAVVPKDEYDAKREAISASLLRSAMNEAHTAGVPAKAIHRGHREPHQAILDIAVAERCDLIVMGSHHSAGLMGALLGSESMKLLAHSKVPVLVFRTSSH